MSIDWAALPATVDLLGECPTWDSATQSLMCEASALSPPTPSALHDEVP